MTERHDKIFSEGFNAYMSKKYIHGYMHEAYFGKNPDFLKVEKLLGVIKQKLLHNVTYDPTLTKENSDIEKLFQKIFNVEIVRLKWEVTMASANAYTIPMQTYKYIESGYRLKEDDLEIEKTKLGLKFKKSEGKKFYMWIGTGCFSVADLSPAEMLAVILHEIGHNFYVLEFNYLKYSLLYNLSNFIGFVIYYIKIKFPGDETYKTWRYNQSSGKEAYKFLSSISEILSSMSMAIMVFLQYLIFIPSFVALMEARIAAIPVNILKGIFVTKNAYAYRNERFADNFATMHGYGIEASSALKKLSTRGLLGQNTAMKIPIYGQVYDALMSIYTTVGYHLCLSDPHPHLHNRIKDQIEMLKEDLNDPKIPKDLKKDMQYQIEQLEELYDAAIDFKTNVKENRSIIMSGLKHLWSKTMGMKHPDGGLLFVDKDHKYNDMKIKDSPTIPRLL